MLLNPIVVVEVLSRSKANFGYYREIPSLQEYLLVHPEAPWIEHFARTPADQWLLTDVRGLDAALSLPGLSVSVPLADIYSGVFDLPV